MTLADLERLIAQATKERDDRLSSDPCCTLYSSRITFRCGCIAHGSAHGNHLHLCRDHTAAREWMPKLLKCARLLERWHESWQRGDEGDDLDAPTRAALAALEPPHVDDAR